VKANINQKVEIEAEVFAYAPAWSSLRPRAGRTDLSPGKKSGGASLTRSSEFWP